MTPYLIPGLDDPEYEGLATAARRVAGVMA